MIFHFKANELDAGLPEVWGIPYHSQHGAGWLVGWYDATGSLQGVTRPTKAQDKWIAANPKEPARMARQREAVLKGGA